MFKKENIRKNFLRVKQIADQNLGRVEKTEVLSDDLQLSEKRVELVKNVCSNTVKKLGGSLLGAATASGDVEKRLKKMPEAAVGHNMIESATILGTDSIMGQLFHMCGECENSLAQTHLQYEMDVERTVVGPVQDILDSEIPQISKLKKALGKLTLDMDSAKSRWNSAVRQTQVPGVNIQSASAKVDVVKDELDETQGRVEQAKDAYTTGMFNFISKETDHSQNLLNLLEAQARYHRHALDIIDTVIPKMREALSCNPTKPVYGVPLEEHLRVTNRDIAQVLEACVCYLLEVGLEEEGLFRIAGMASKVKKLKASFDAGMEFDDNGELDAHTVAGALKQYLRELPEPLLTFQLFPDFMAAAQQSQDQRLQSLWCVVDRLPKPNYDNFRYLVKFLAKLTEKSEVNKMTPTNIAIVIGPNLIWSEGDSGPNMMNTGILSLITELIVHHADWFFPGDIDFHATQRGTAPEHRMSEMGHLSQKPSVRNSNPVATTSKQQQQQQQRQSLPVLPSTTPSGRACGAAFTTALGVISGLGSSSEASASSSETSSLSEMTSQMKHYENADTLERDDNGGNGFHTAKGELPPSSTTSIVASASKRFSHTNTSTNPVITFNAKDLDKYRKSKGLKTKVGSNPEPLSRSAGMSNSGLSQSVHSDMYSTAFALQSLGDGTWPTYLTKVRAMWDDQLQTKATADANNDKCIVRSSAGKGHSRSNQEVNFGLTGSNESESPNLNKTADEHENLPLKRTGSTQSGSSQGAPQSSPANQEPASPQAPPQTPPSASRSPSVSPATSSPNLQGAPLAESEDLHPTLSSSAKKSRKPAPPPPPNRPYSVAVSASVRPNQQTAQFQTWPRQAANPLLDSSPNSHAHGDRQSMLAAPDRPHPPERVSSLPSHGHTIERPKIPPPVVPPSHQRSASTGAATVIIPGSQLHSADTIETGTGTGSVGNSYVSAGNHSDSASLQCTAQLAPTQQYSTGSLSRHSSAARPLRPLPPPPPPPAENAVLEQTHL